MPKGGYRQPMNPAPVSGPGALSQRTDGGATEGLTQPQQRYSGMAYGENKSVNDQQGGAALAGNPFPMADLLTLDAPSARPNEPITHGINLGAGAGITYKNPNGFNASVNYISNQLGAGNSTAVEGVNGTGVGSASTTTAQFGYAKQNWGAAFAYTYSNAANNIALNDPNASYISAGANNLGFSAYWQPTKTGYIPSISAGVGTTYYNGGDSVSTWQVALQWQDAFVKGNALGMAYGDTQIGGTEKGNTAYELFYKFQVTDNISVTPAFFWINGGGENADSTGGVLKTTFKF